jgi:hypothetical protein
MARQKRVTAAELKKLIARMRLQGSKTAIDAVMQVAFSIHHVPRCSEVVGSNVRKWPTAAVTLDRVSTTATEATTDQMWFSTVVDRLPKLRLSAQLPAGRSTAP